MNQWLEANLTITKVVSLGARLCAAYLAYISARAGYDNLMNAWHAYPGDYSEILRTVVAGLAAIGFAVVCGAVTVARSFVYTQMATLGFFVVVFTASIAPWPDHAYAAPNMSAVTFVSVVGILLSVALLVVAEVERTKLRKKRASARQQPGALAPLAQAAPPVGSDTIVPSGGRPSL